MTANSLPFAPSAIAPAKLVLLGSWKAEYRRVFDPVCSLQESEYVSAEDMVRQEIAKGSALGMAAARAQAAGRQPADGTMLAMLRRWFWTRKSTRGFVLTGVPATRMQAVVFDQWLEERDEALTACLWIEERTGATHPDAEALPRYYRERGLLVKIEAGSVDAVAEQVGDWVAPLVAGR